MCRHCQGRRSPSRCFGWLSPADSERAGGHHHVDSDRSPEMHSTQVEARQASPPARVTATGSAPRWRVSGAWRAPAVGPAGRGRARSWGSETVADTGSNHDGAGAKREPPGPGVGAASASPRRPGAQSQRRGAAQRLGGSPCFIPSTAPGPARPARPGPAAGTIGACEWHGHSGRVRRTQQPARLVRQTVITVRASPGPPPPAGRRGEAEHHDPPQPSHHSCELAETSR